MPYRTVFEPAELFLKCGDVEVYNTYKDDEIEQGTRTFHFVTDEEHGEFEAFDVRDLSTWRSPRHPPFTCGKDDTPKNRKLWEEYHNNKVEEKAIKRAIRLSVKKGEITKHGFNKKEE